jgi:hypothetical protein
MSDFRVDGFGCWCPDERTLGQLRLAGHTPECRQARQGWAANMRHLSAIERERREAEEVGRQMLASARAVLASGETTTE